jgi:TusA-related sulfurtransferase
MRSYDLTGIRCPLPIVELNRIVGELSGGEAFEVAVDDPAFELDVVAWSGKTGHGLVSQRTQDGVCHAVIRVSGP